MLWRSPDLTHSLCQQTSQEFKALWAPLEKGTWLAGERPTGLSLSFQILVLNPSSHGEGAGPRGYGGSVPSQYSVSARLPSIGKSRHGHFCWFFKIFPGPKIPKFLLILLINILLINTFQSLSRVTLRTPRHDFQLHLSSIQILNLFLRKTFLYPLHRT